jgi:hypothetical protein
MTNDLGHKLARSVGETMTLGAYRRGNQIPMSIGRSTTYPWVPGALIDVWVPCARGEAETGVPAPHVYFVQTIGEKSADSGSIHCPECRVDLAARRVSGSVGSPRSMAPAPLPSPPTSQAVLPF